MQEHSQSSLLGVRKEEPRIWWQRKGDRGAWEKRVKTTQCKAFTAISSHWYVPLEALMTQ